jgi:hypothetical protein
VQQPGGVQLASRSGSRLRFFPVAVLLRVGSRSASCLLGKAPHTGSRQSLPQAVGCPVSAAFSSSLLAVPSFTRKAPSVSRTVRSLGYHRGSCLRSPSQFRARQASLHFSSPSTSVTVQMQQVVASFTGSAMPRASRLAKSLPSCAGWCTCVAPNPLVKGTSCAYAQAAPYRER